jgi:hypothetical protein
MTSMTPTANSGNILRVGRAHAGLRSADGAQTSSAARTDHRPDDLPLLVGGDIRDALSRLYLTC